MMTRCTLPARRTALMLGIALALGVAAGAATTACAFPSDQAAQKATVRDSRQAWQPQPVPAVDLESAASEHAPMVSSIVTAGVTHAVTTCADDAVTPPAGSLREAVANAASGDIVDMSDLACSDIELDGSIYTVLTDLTLLGDSETRIKASASNYQSLIVHEGTGVLTLKGLTFSDTHKYTAAGTSYSKYGGCIRSDGSVVLDHTTVENCHLKRTAAGVTSYGGAIYAAGNVGLKHSRVSGSSVIGTSVSRGGGIFAGGRLLIEYSTVDGNSVTATAGTGQGGGAWVNGLTMRYSTVSNNTAETIGGLASLPGSNAFVSIKHSTISGNHTTSLSGDSAGMYLYPNDPVDLESTTITANVSNATNPTTAAGLTIRQHDIAVAVTMSNSFISGNSNVGQSSDFEFKNTGSGMLAAITGSHNLMGSVLSPAVLPADTIHQEFAPMGPLQDNGGPTWTQLPGADNWAVNTGASSALGDQRQADRLQGTAVDIGAAESDALLLARFEHPPLFP